MPTLSYPAPVSRGLGGFSEGFLGGLALLRQFRDAEERQRRRNIEEPYLLARTAALEREAGAPAETGRIMERVFGPPQTLAQPSGPVLPLAAWEPPTLAPPPAVPSGAAPVPAGQEAVSESEAFARAGGEGMAKLQAAGVLDPLRRAGKILPDAEIRRRIEHARVMQDVVGPERKKADALLLEGTPEALEQAYLRFSRAARALAPTQGTPEERSATERRGEEYLQKAAALRQDRAEAQRESKDLRRLAEAQQRIANDPDSAEAVATVAEVVASVTSKAGRAETLKFMHKRFETAVQRQQESGPIRQLLGAVTDGFREYPGNAEAAWDYAFKQNPEAFSAAAGHNMEQGKPVPPPVAKRVFGPEAPKDRMQAAHAVAINAGPVGSPRYMKALKEIYADLGAPDDAPKLRDVLTRLRGQEESTFRTLLLRLKDVSGTANEDLVQQEIDAARANMRALDAELRRLGIPLAPPKVAGATEGADPKRALLPPAAATRKDALAEKQRLLGLGHTPESARAAMRSAGWFVGP